MEFLQVHKKIQLFLSKQQFLIIYYVFTLKLLTIIHLNSNYHEKFTFKSVRFERTLY